MRLAVRLCVCAAALLVVAEVEARRGGGGGISRGGFKPRAPAPRPKPHSTGSSSSSSSTFLNNERGAGHKPSAPNHPAPPPVHTNGPLGFEKFDGNNRAGAGAGTHQIGFDKVNSQAGNSRTASAPPYPGTNNGPPPPYPGTHTGSGYGDHPPAYPGRPVNAPPSYSASNPHNNQPGQQSYPTQQYFGNSFGNANPQQNQFGNGGHGYYPNGGSNTGAFGGGNSYGGNYPQGNSYHGNAYGGSPFGNGGQTGNPYYNPNNFGYSNNPGYYGSQGYPGQYDNYQKKSRFGGLPIPIPIPIPIPLGGFGGGGYSYRHRELDTFIRNQTVPPSGNSSTAVFLLNNNTVAPCTSDHFMYGSLKVTVVSCTAEFCTAAKLYATTNVSNVASVHSAGLTLCLEKNATSSYSGDNVTPTASELQRENVTVCRNVPANRTAEGEEASTTTEAATTEVSTTTTVATTTITTNTSADNATSEVCETVECFRVEMCLPAIEVVDACPSGSADCPFRRTGYKPCVTLKTCRSASAPVSFFASLNTTVSKIDEYNHHESKSHGANLTLISYHRPVMLGFDNTTTTTTTPPR